MTRPAASPRPPSLAERLGELEKGVTEGPWTGDASEVPRGGSVVGPDGLWVARIFGEHLERDLVSGAIADTAFIARSRNLWPLLTEGVVALAATGWSERDGRCWCPESREITGAAEHSPRCERAREALARLAAALDEEGQR